MAAIAFVGRRPLTLLGRPSDTVGRRPERLLRLDAAVPAAPLGVQVVAGQIVGQLAGVPRPRRPVLLGARPIGPDDTFFAI